MQCRVGITTNPDERRSYWENQVVGFKNWQILGRYQSRQQAQDHEQRAAKQYGCKAHAGGSDASGTWHVYKFEYTRMKG